MKIKNIMLIDDNKIDLFVNQRIIQKYNSAVNTKSFTSATSAISFFNLMKLNTDIKTCSIPDVILLDINMPEMNGFGFLEEFKRLKMIDKGKVSIYMLSSSICPNDILRAEKDSHCSGYITKPLTVQKLQNVLNKSEEVQPLQQFKKII